jgi:serine protein kinase
MTVHNGTSLLDLVKEMQDQRQFLELNWSGTFADYLDIVTKNPRVTRNAFQRIYDMIMQYGVEEFVDAKKRLIHILW